MWGEKSRNVTPRIWGTCNICEIYSELLTVMLMWHTNQTLIKIVHCWRVKPIRVAAQLEVMWRVNPIRLFPRERCLMHCQPIRMEDKLHWGCTSDQWETSRDRGVDALDTMSQWMCGTLGCSGCSHTGATFKEEQKRAHVTKLVACVTLGGRLPKLGRWTGVCGMCTPRFQFAVKMVNFNLPLNTSAWLYTRRRAKLLSQ